MAFIKAQMYWLIVGLVAAASVGMGTWGAMSGSAIEERMTSIDRLGDEVQRLGREARNAAVIEQKRVEMEQKKRDFAEAEDTALRVQRYNPFYEVRDANGGVVKRKERAPLVPNVLPSKVLPSDALQFKVAYKRMFPHDGDQPGELLTKLNATDKPTDAEIQTERRRIDIAGGGGRRRPGEEEAGNPWDILLDPDDLPARKGERTRLDILRENPASIAAYNKALKAWMYVSDGAFGVHRLANAIEPPHEIEIWQAQMSLWIQQDIAAALYRANEEQAARLRADGLGSPWVAYLPVKHLKRLSIANRLGGEGGGSNIPGSFAPSSTGRVNNPDMFVVPLQLLLVVEQTALSRVLDHICGVGFYTPINVSYEKVPPNPTQVDYIYGPAPVIEATIDLEAYYFRKVFDQWIPEGLRAALASPDIAAMSGSGSSGGGQGMRFNRGG